MSLPIPIKFRTIESLKFLLLNVCAHDPWHDFESGARTYDKEDKIGGKIAKDMNDLYILCNRIDQRRSTISGGAGEAEEQGQEYERLNNIGEQLIEKLVDLEKTSVLPGNAGVEELKESEDSDSESIDISSFKTVAEIKNILKKRSIQLTDDFVGMVTNQVFLPIIKFSINIIIESQQKDEISNVENQIDSEVLSDEVPPGDEVPRVEVPPGDEDNDDDSDSDSEEAPLVTKEQIERENLQSEEIIQKQQEIVELLSSQEESIIEPSQILSLENLYSYIDSTTDLESTMNDDKYNSLRVRTDANRETTISNIFQKQENLESLKNPILFESCLNELKKVDSVYKGLSDNIEIDGHEVEVDDQEKTQKYLLTQDEKMSESSSESYVSIIKDFLDNTIKPVDQSAAEAKQDEEYDSKKLFNTILKAENILKKTLLKPIIECIENLDRQDINVEKSSIFKLNDIILLFIDAKKHLKVGEYLNFFPNSLNEMNQLDADDQIDLLKKMKRKLLTIVHTDHANLNKQACSGEPDKSYCEKLFKKLLKININSLFATDNEGSDEGAAAQQDEEGNKMEGGAKRKDRLYNDLPEINKIILSKQTEFIMKWLNLLNLTNSTEMKGLEDFNFASALFINPDRYPELKQFMGLQPGAQIKGSISGQAQKDKFQKIEQLMIDKKKKAYRDLIKPLYVWIKPEGETGSYVNLGYCIPSHFILNAQLLILGSKINFYKKGSFNILEFINKSKSISPSATKYDISAIEILGPLSFSEYNSWTSGNIDDQLQEMMNIIITYIGFEDPSNFELDEDKMKNESGYNKQIFSDQAGERFPKKIGEKEFFGERFDFPNTDKQFIVNNASSFSKILTFGGLTKDKISKKVFCPIASILDAMKNCSISSALKNKTCILNPMNFEISDSSNNITYNISYITPKSNSCPNLSAYEKEKGFIILSISLSKLINTDSNPDSSSSPIIFNKCIPYSGSQLSATLAYKDIISNFYKAYTTISSSPEVRSTRFANSLILESKFVPIINFIDSVIADVFQNTIVKSIGDYAQEGVVSSKFSALEDLIQKSSLSPTILSSISSNKNNLEGDSFRVGVANDRPSAYRMIYTSLFATKNSKNHGAIVGYYGPETSNKNFMVFPKIPNIYQIESPESIRKVTQGSLDNRYQIFLDYLVSSENISKLTSSSSPPTAGGGIYKTKKRKRTRKRKNKSTKKKKNKKNKKSKNRKNKKRNSLKK